jgi:hypothetical protein
MGRYTNMGTWMKVSVFSAPANNRVVKIMRSSPEVVSQIDLNSPNEAFWVEVVDELVAKFQKQEERRSHLERPDTRVYDLILGPPTGQAWLDIRLEEAAGWLKAE